MRIKIIERQTTKTKYIILYIHYSDPYYTHSITCRNTNKRLYTQHIPTHTSAHRTLYIIITHNTIFKNKSAQLFHNNNYSNFIYREISVNPLTLRSILIYITVWNMNIVYIYIYIYIYTCSVHYTIAIVQQKFLIDSCKNWLHLGS